MAYIEAKHLSKTYDSGGVRCEALKDGNFSIEEGSLSVILGPSGAGKTTLLNLLGGMDWITGGSLTVDGCSLEGLGQAAGHLQPWCLSYCESLFAQT